jgi:hypothetical protein
LTRSNIQAYLDLYARGSRDFKKDIRVIRPVQRPSLAEVLEIPQVGGLHRLYTQKTA